MRAQLGALVILAVLGATHAHAQDDESAARAACGEAMFAMADGAGGAFERLDLSLAPDLPAAVVMRRLGPPFSEALQQALAIAGRYENVVRCGDARWTIAAYVRQGDVYRHLVDATHAATASLPRALERTESMLRPIACVATVRYLLAVRASRIAIAQSQSIDCLLSQHALDVLLQTPTSELSSCAAEEQRHDSTFAPLTSSDLTDLPPP